MSSPWQLPLSSMATDTARDLWEEATKDTEVQVERVTLPCPLEVLATALVELVVVVDTVATNCPVELNNSTPQTWI